MNLRITQSCLITTIYGILRTFSIFLRVVPGRLTAGVTVDVQIHTLALFQAVGDNSRYQLQTQENLCLCREPKPRPQVFFLKSGVLIVTQAKQVGLDLYSGGAWFESRPGHQIS
jgi:hypothetical protein